VEGSLATIDHLDLLLQHASGPRFALFMDHEDEPADHCIQHSISTVRCGRAYGAYNFTYTDPVCAAIAVDLSMPRIE
jgi:hypothetical protein